MKNGFTLAEVLITLGIIGIVAAMTLPAVLASYRKKEIEVRLKKFSSTMQNAFNFATVDYGPIQNWKYPTKQNDADEINDFMFTYLFPYLQGIKVCESGDAKCNQFHENFTGHTSNIMPVYIFSDGSCFTMVIGGSSADMGVATIHYWFDYNCAGKPNKENEDIFKFVTRFVNNKGTLFSAGNWRTHEIQDRNTLLEYCKTSDTGDERGSGSCTRLIEYDGWEIKDDYPWIR